MKNIYCISLYYEKYLQLLWVIGIKYLRNFKYLNFTNYQLWKK